ncbi:MAG: response regulator [Chloroflexi bacterium]|jgi:DNA-binding NarL/FixJ family response regulator|nr:response regulator [Chloroflexota bacterium]
MLDTTTILIIDAHPSVRNALRALIETESDIVVVGDGHDFESAVKMAHTLQPDVIILDMMSASKDGIGMVRAVRRSSPKSQIIILTDHDYSNRVVDVFREGVRGFLLKDPLSADIIAAIRGVLDGKIIIHREVANAIPGATELLFENQPATMPELFPFA